MSETSGNIFERVLLRPVEPGGRGLAHLSWRAKGLGGRVVQVYLDDLLHDAAPAEQREMWLHLEGAFAHRVRLLAADPGEAWTDRADRLGGEGPGYQSSASLALVRDEALAVDARVVVAVDGEAEPGRALWGPGEARGGFGGLFGVEAFGYGMASGPGLGRGEMGLGPFGADGFAWRWRRDDLSDGPHEIAPHVEDASGRVIGEADPRTVMIERPPRPARSVRLDDDFILRWE